MDKEPVGHSYDSAPGPGEGDRRKTFEDSRKIPSMEVVQGDTGYHRSGVGSMPLNPSSPGISQSDSSASFSRQTSKPCSAEACSDLQRYVGSGVLVASAVFLAGAGIKVLSSGGDYSEAIADIAKGSVTWAGKFIADHTDASAVWQHGADVVASVAEYTGAVVAVKKLTDCCVPFRNARAASLTLPPKGDSYYDRLNDGDDIGSNYNPWPTLASER